MKNLFFISFCLLLGTNVAQGQVTSRSGQPGPVSAVPEVLPCPGSATFSADFESGLPGTWSVLDLDGLSPRPEISLAAGWQTRNDYNDSTNTVMVSPSWYVTPGVSNDWLITPQITLGTNTCLSWYAYSQDQFYPESYEVRISTSAPDTAGFFAHPALLMVEEENHAPIFRSLNLSAYAGQQVYIAFRHTSDDQFVLVLDEVSTTEVSALDAGVYLLDNPGGNASDTVDGGDTLTVSGFIGNYGSDTLTSVTVNWNADGGPVSSFLMDSIHLAPNDTLWFAHSTPWITDSLPHFYTLCAWTSSPNGSADQVPSNDTNCIGVSIGGAISIDDPFSLENELLIWPQPAADAFTLRFKGTASSLDWQLFTLHGVALPMRGILHSQEAVTIDAAALAPGIYLVRMQAGAHCAVKKLIIQK